MMKKSVVYTMLTICFILFTSAGCNSDEKKNVEAVNKIKQTSVSSISKQLNNKKIEKNSPVSNTTQETTIDNRIPYATDLKLKNNDMGVPVLMFHSVDYEKGNVLRVPKERFREEMKYLKDNGYTTLSLQEVYDFIKDNKPIPEKSVAITFDDGYEDNYTNAFPILKEYGLKATIFMISAGVDNDKAYLKSAELKEMENYGIDIESHTVHHDDLAKLSYEDQLKTLEDSKKCLEDIINKKIDFIAYPCGHYNENTLKAVETAGYKMAFLSDGRWSYPKNGIYTLCRVYISAYADLNEFITRITNPNYQYRNY